MPAKKYLVTLTEDERRSLRELIKKGSLAACKLARADISLLPTKAEPTTRLPQHSRLSEVVRVGIVEEISRETSVAR